MAHTVFVTGWCSFSTRSYDHKTSTNFYKLVIILCSCAYHNVFWVLQSCRGLENEYQSDRTTILARSDFLEISDNLRSALLPTSNRNDRIPKKFMIPGGIIYFDLGFAGIYSTMFRDFPRFFCFVVKFGRFLDMRCPGIFRIWPQNKKI